MMKLRHGGSSTLWNCKDMIHKNILFTGPPRCGKSTLIQKIVQRIEKPMTGFFTSEIREKGQRVGFSITTLDGKKGILAHVNIRSLFKVGKYGVHIEDIDRIAVPSMTPSKGIEIVVIDEIGKMECFSKIFKKTLMAILDSNHRVIGSIAIKGGQFIQSIKERSDVQLIRLSEENRDKWVEMLYNAL
jgi:nucleoside-triphosphatase THEP1